MLMRIVEWYIGTETDFSVSAGKGGKFMRKYLQPEIYSKLLLTYSDAEIERNKNSLLVMTELFASLAKHTAGKLGFTYNIDDEVNVMGYLESVFKDL